MRLMVCGVLVLLAGCASEQQVAEFEQQMPSEIDCPGGVERSYSTTIYSSDEPETFGKTKVSAKCKQIDMRSDLEKQNGKL